jgi:AcrR family transcriptional regulator
LARSRDAGDNIAGVRPPGDLMTKPKPREERRQELLARARDVFAKQGFHDATVDDIVKAAGVARGTFYLYFEDKRAIFEELVDRVITRLGMAILRVDPHDPGRSVEEQVRENIHRIFKTLLDDPATTRILLRDAVGLDKEFDRKLLSFYDETCNLLDESLRDGQKLGVVREGDTRMFAVLTIGAMKELLYQVVMRGWDLPGERLEQELFRLLRTGYLRV